MLGWGRPETGKDLRYSAHWAIWACLPRHTLSKRAGPVLGLGFFVFLRPDAAAAAPARSAGVPVGAGRGGQPGIARAPRGRGSFLIRSRALSHSPAPARRNPSGQPAWPRGPRLPVAAVGPLPLQAACRSPASPLAGSKVT